MEQNSHILSGDADMVIAPSVSGEIGILTGHQPTMLTLKPGVVRISATNDGKTNVTEVEVTGGFLSLYNDSVTIVADSAKVR